MSASQAIASARACNAPFVVQNEYGAFDVALPEGTADHCGKETEIPEVVGSWGYDEYFLLRQGEECGTKKQLVLLV